MRETNKCISCGIVHSQVECGGIYYCPNALCTVSGATWFRHKLDSYKDHGSYHTVDDEELLTKGLAYAETVQDWTIRNAILNSASNWQPAIDYQI